MQSASSLSVAATRCSSASRTILVREAGEAGETGARNEVLIADLATEDGIE
ncbi:hypothetical protein AB0D91_40150 [Streptomyces canus]|uniref:hypothetical protein n=1 Tax=Streptomyces canus TaxID=58343 RepID=UPI0034050B11